VDETEGVVGLPEFLYLFKYALDSHLGNVISQSWGTSERYLDGPDGRAMAAMFDAFYQAATDQGVTVLTASGDGGETAGNAPWPATVPAVTAVGGTLLKLGADGRYGSESVWATSGGASGSGVSHFYDETPEQALLPQPLQAQLGGHRGEADVSAVASNLGIWFTIGSDPAPTAHATGGTSASTPIWAGVVALADQQAGRGLGNLNPLLYQLGAAGACFHDITAGDNSVRNRPGQPALAGWDFPTGWGSPDAACLVPRLAAGA